MGLGTLQHSPRTRLYPVDGNLTGPFPPSPCVLSPIFVRDISNDCKRKLLADLSTQLPLRKYATMKQAMATILFDPRPARRPTLYKRRRLNGTVEP